MKLLVFALLVLSLHTGAASSLRDLKEPIKRCTVPKRLEGKFNVKIEIGGIVIGTGTGTVHADGTLGRGAIFEKVHAGGRTTEVNVFIHSNSQQAYYATPSLKMCQKKSMPFLPGTVPEGGNLHVRRGKVDGRPVQIWDGRSKRDTTRVGSMHIYLTEDTCMPVKMEFTMSLNGQTFFVTEDWYDMKEGIEDASVFDLPKYCVKKSNYGITQFYNSLESHDWHVRHAMARQEAHSHLFD